MERITVVGMGYIGLPTASLLASRGFKVHGVDVFEHVVDTINRGEVHIVEPDLDQQVKAVVHQGNLTASLKPQEADVFILAVPTPFHKGEGHRPNIDYIADATTAIAPFVKPGDLVILESTSPVGTTEMVGKWLAQAREDLTIDSPDGSGECVYVAHCPERVLPGHILRELVENDRIVGGVGPRSTRKAAEFYHKFVKGSVLQTNARTAELAKLTENSFRDVNIAFANELSLICDRLDIDVWELIELANRHPRVNILQPGPGVGGHCIAVDPWFIVDAAPDEAKLIHTARLVNDGKPTYVIDKVREAKRLKPRAKIACLGLAFKPNIDDLRESPALDICYRLAQFHPGEVVAVEPHIESLPDEMQQLGVKLVSLGQALEQAEIVVLLVDHDAFRGITLEQVSHCELVDTRGLVR